MPRKKPEPKPKADNTMGKAKAESQAESQSDGFEKTELTADERQALHFRHVKEYEVVIGAKNASVAALEVVAKRIKAEGGSVALCKLTIALRTEEGTDAFKERIARETEVAEWNGVGVQVDLFADVDRTPAVDRSRSEGRRDGLAGNPCKPNHSPETEQYRYYMDGFHEGQAVLAKGIRAPVPMASDATDSLAKH